MNARTDQPQPAAPTSTAPSMIQRKDPVGRVQWSKLGITIYSSAGAFVCRLEQQWERELLNEYLMRGLKHINMLQHQQHQSASAHAQGALSANMDRTMEAHDAIQVESADAGGVQRSTGQADEGLSPRVGSGDAEHAPAAGQGQPAETSDVDAPATAAVEEVAAVDDQYAAPV